MRDVCRALFVAALCLVAPAISPVWAQQQQRPRRLVEAQKVQKIHVGDLGPAEEAESFRIMLEEQLLKRGFEVVLHPEDADAALTGVITVQYYEYKSDARVTVRLESQTGDVLWAKNIGPKRFVANPFDTKEPMQRRAEEVAEALRKEFRRGAKKGP